MGSARSILPAWAYPWVHRGLSRLFPDSLWQLPIQPGSHSIALTFDDGPHPDYTPRLLEVLAHFDVKATFFVLGERAQRWPEVVAQMAAEGHQLALHGWQHRSFPSLSPSELRQSLRQTQEMLATATGGIPESFCWVRPPNGLVWPQTVRQLQSWGYETVMWSVVPEDWLEPPIPVILERVQAQVQPGSLIVLHDGIYGGSQVAEVTERLIPLLKAQEYEFTTLVGIHQQKAA